MPSHPGSQRRHAPHRTEERATARRLLVALLLFGAQACTYDFDQFRDAPAADMSGQGDLGDPDMMTAPDDGSELGPGDDLGLDMEDMAPAGAAIGAACASDAACVAGATCEVGICTQVCAEDAACADPAVCRVIEPGRARCVLGCEEDADCEAGRVCGAGACLPDSDGDSIADWIDNCPDMANATQEDADLDGVGDACDADALCPEGHVDGVRALDLTGLVGLSGLAQTASTRHVMLTSEAGVGLLDLKTGTYRTHAALPYAAGEHGIIGLGAGEAWLTPGVGLGQASGQIGRWLRVTAAGEVSEGGPFVQDVRLPGGAVSRFGATLLVSTQARSAPTNLQVERVAPASGGASLLTAYNVPDVGQMWALETSQGEVMAYSAPFQPAADQPWAMVRWVFNVNGDQIDGRVIALPNAEGTDQPISPVFIRTRPGYLVGLDRRTGQAWRLVVGRPEGEWIRAAGLDVSWGVDAPRVVALKHSAGLLVLGESGGALVGKQIALACLPGAAQADADGDGVSDVRDTCPDVAEADQADLDGDGFGDVCDDDDDADGIPDALDVRVVNAETGETESLALDTDNDGVPNAQDDDDDGDGVPDVRDRFPLDPDDDGLALGEDSDNDNDGYSDAEEQALGTDPRSRLSFPGGGRLAWVRPQGAGTVVEIAAMGALDRPEALELGVGAAPSRVRWAPSSEHVLVVDGEPGAATAVLLQQPGLTVAPQRFEIGQKVRSAALVAPDPNDPSGKPGVVVVHEAEGMAGRWVVSRIAWEDDVTRRLIVGGLTAIGEVAGFADRLYLSGATATCAGCERGWTVLAREEQRLAAVLPNVRAVREVRRAGGTICAVGATSAEDETPVAWVGQAMLMPPRAVEVEQCVPLGQDGHLIVRAKDAEGSYAVWLFNGRIQGWVRLPGTLSSVRDLDWRQ